MAFYGSLRPPKIPTGYAEVDGILQSVACAARNKKEASGGAHAPTQAFALAYSRRRVKWALRVVLRDFDFRKIWTNKLISR